MFIWTSALLLYSISLVNLLPLSRQNKNLQYNLIRRWWWRRRRKQQHEENSVENLNHFNGLLCMCVRVYKILSEIEFYSESSKNNNDQQCSFSTCRKINPPDDSNYLVDIWNSAYMIRRAFIVCLLLLCMQCEYFKNNLQKLRSTAPWITMSTNFVPNLNEQQFAAIEI